MSFKNIEVEEKKLEETLQF